MSFPGSQLREGDLGAGGLLGSALGLSLCGEGKESGSGRGRDWFPVLIRWRPKPSHSELWSCMTLQRCPAVRLGDGPWYPLHSRASHSGERQLVLCCRVESAVSCRPCVLGPEEESGWPTLASSTKTYLFFPAFIKYLTEGSSHYQDNNLMQH